MKMVKEELDAKLKAHVKWLETRFTCNVEGARADLTCADLTGSDLTGADLTDADLTDADLTRADLNIFRASPFVFEAIAASFAAQIALKKTRIKWRQNH